MSKHTKDVLADELRKAGLWSMAQRAADGYYHDFLSPLAMPMNQLVSDLQAVGTPAALAIRDRAINGEFDAAEGEEEMPVERPAPPEAEAPPQTIGSGPVDSEYIDMMKGVARGIDDLFNGDVRPKKVGFILMVFPFDDVGKGRCNYMSNADRADVITLLKEQLSYFGGMSDKHAEGRKA